MSNIIKLSILLFSFFIQNAIAQVTDSIVDQRDGQIYKTTQIGKQVWMAQNLNFSTEKSWCYNNSSENCDKFGRLYAWEAAKNACPAGWHLPSDKEWQELEKSLGMDDADLSKSNAWRGKDQGLKLISDKSISFNILMGGFHNPPSNFNLLNMQAFFWTSSEEGGSAWFRQFYENNPKIFRRTRPASWAFSVRCILN
jgi:uncharacterized protein (TIGR02145 family)